MFSSSTEDILKELKTSIHSEKELNYFFTHQERYKYTLGKIVSLDLKNKPRVLDIGCYPPHLFPSMEKLDFEVFGISSKHEVLKLKNIVTLNIEEKTLPFPENNFDLVLMAEIIEHLLANPLVYLREIWRVLKPNGFLLITTPNVVNLKNRVRILLGKNVYFSLQQLFETNLDNDSIYYRHNREYTINELKEVLCFAGFIIRNCEYFSAYTPFRENVKHNSVLSKIIKTVGFYITLLYPKFRDSIYLEAKKV